MEMNEIQEIINKIAKAMGKENETPKAVIGEGMKYDKKKNEIIIEKGLMNKPDILIGGIGHEMAHFYHGDNSFDLKRINNVVKESRADIDGYYFLNKAFPEIDKEKYTAYHRDMQAQHERDHFTKKDCLKSGYFPCDKRIDLINKYNKFTEEAEHQVKRDFNTMSDKFLKIKGLSHH